MKLNDDLNFNSQIDSHVSLGGTWRKNFDKMCEKWICSGDTIQY